MTPPRAERTRSAASARWAEMLDDAATCLPTAAREREGEMASITGSTVITSPATAATIPRTIPVSL